VGSPALLTSLRRIRLCSGLLSQSPTGAGASNRLGRGNAAWRLCLCLPVPFRRWRYAWNL